jgi:hypothetical protein
VRPANAHLGMPDRHKHHTDRVNFGGGGRNRTGLDGFAIRCITSLPPRPIGASAFFTAEGTSPLCGSSDPAQTKREAALASLSYVKWSGKRDSNSRPQPWQGCALPTELFPHSTQGPNYSVHPMRVNRSGLSLPEALQTPPSIEWRAASIRTRIDAVSCTASGCSISLHERPASRFRSTTLARQRPRIGRRLSHRPTRAREQTAPHAGRVVCRCLGLATAA